MRAVRRRHAAHRRCHRTARIRRVRAQLQPAVSMAAPRGAACRPCVSVAWLEFGCSQGVGASVLASSRPIRSLSAALVPLRCVGWFGGVCQLADARSANWHIPLRTPTGLSPPAVFPPRPAGASPARRQRSARCARPPLWSASAARGTSAASCRTLGGRATPPPCLARNSAMTTRGSSPVRKRASASSRTDGQEYDPGRCGGVPPRSAARWAVSAALRRFVIQPCADHRRCRVSTKSRPPRCCWNSSDAWSGQSQTATPNPRATACARPRVRSAQIAQGSPLAAIPRAL